MFEKHCPMCGMEVKKEIAIKRFGKYLCSEQHAEEFAVREQQRQDEESHKDRREVAVSTTLLYNSEWKNCFMLLKLGDHA